MTEIKIRERSTPEQIVMTGTHDEKLVVFTNYGRVFRLEYGGRWNWQEIPAPPLKGK